MRTFTDYEHHGLSLAVVIAWEPCPILKMPYISLSSPNDELLPSSSSTIPSSETTPSLPIQCS